ncbi:MAG: cell filamentation protein Fic [Gammaproteobacteria bacterium RIFCSPHIGHO2_12_FULL_38_14]|nr:MAG: cell filamentation protein Fic [Gammaproteobacteria bacterium RIFCSPHIGHO2_12_FULL_38_14]
MFKPKFTITNSIANTLTTIERARGFLEAATLSDEWVVKMQNKALILEAHYTTHIEGTQLTLEQSEQLWAGQYLATANPDDTRELLNYRQAFDLVAGYVGDGEPITEGLIREIHKRLVEGVRGNAATPGDYRKIQNYVVNSKTKDVIYTPPAAYEVPQMMHELVDWINHESEIHPVLISGIAQFQLVHIHPFLDGNGRTARLLSTLCLYQRGYDFKKLFTISEYYDRNRSDYYQAIQSVREQDMDMTGWIEYFVQGLSAQLQEVKSLGKQAIEQDALVRQYHLSDRQKLVIEYIAKYGGISIQQFEEICPDVTRRTLQRELKELIDKNILTTTGATSNLIYEMKIKSMQDGTDTIKGIR